ncbi:MAG: hypothetical protein ACRC20_10285 [Segniliparus sp.]|uniref:hypothetical protein n=1 Tax=Segniliparus sp. TaxID=2804064 RepID=UPI003F32F7D3
MEGEEMRVFSKYAVAKTAAAIAIGAGAIGGGPIANADVPEGSSAKIIDGVGKLPCDSVIYPVLESKNPYTEPAGTKQTLPVNIESTLKVSNAKTTTNQVQVVKMTGVQFTLEWAPKFADSAAGKAGLTYTHQTTTTYTDGSSVSFSQENTIKIKPKASGLTATPVYQKMQGWGAQYRCKTGSSNKERIGDAKNVKVDLVLSSGWQIEKDGKPASSGDYSSR